VDDNGKSEQLTEPKRDLCAWVFAAGPEVGMPAWTWLAKPDLVVCADGGLEHALKLGLRPNIVVGDFDSVPAATLAGFRAQYPDVDVRAYQHETKIETDTELAVLAALEAGATELIITGALGGRTDHSLANMLLLGHPLLSRTRARIITAGLLYPLLEDTLYSGFGRGVSNVLQHTPANVSQREGRMWVVIRHET
jgi:thiamine pyrophosphokinase